MPVSLNLRPLDKFASQIDAALKHGGNTGPMAKAIETWAEVYRGFVQERFSRMSRGGWKPLKPSTIKARRKGKGRTVKVTRGGKSSDMSVAGGSVAILIDTGTLRGALDPRLNVAKGALQKRVPFGVVVGYGGAAVHEKSRGRIAMIANAHQKGVPPHLPARPIIVEPDARTMAEIVRVTQNALRKTWKAATGAA